MYWSISKNKYKSGLYYLSQKSFVEPSETLDDLLDEASRRFVLRYAQYRGQINFVAPNVPGYAGGVLDAAAAAILATEFNKANLNLIPASPLLINFAQDAYDIIQSMFSTVTGFTGVSTEVNTATLSINDIFRRIQPYSLIVNGDQRFDESCLVLQNGTLTLDECSQDLATLDAHVSVPVYVAKACATTFANFNFSMFSTGAITFLYGTTNQFTGTLATAPAKGEGLFSAVTKEVRFNFGLQDFDVCHQCYDNFGRFLNKTGDLIETSELDIGASQRFLVSSYYTSKLFVQRFFPGKAPEGV
jgi:hypothetical protein